MKRVGLAPWDLEKTKQHVGRGIGYLVESAVGATKKDEAVKIFRQDYGETCLARTYLLPSVSETLPRFRASGLRLAVATNKALVFTERILAHLEVYRYFECVLGPEAVARPKPHPDMIDTILARLELAKQACLYVGDMPLDVETASRAGLDCLLVATGPYAYPTLQREVSVPVLEAFAEIPHFLKME
jgi:phosphoglycolate phosphatase